jgi:hypothetical protein
MSRCAIGRGQALRWEAFEIADSALNGMVLLGEGSRVQIAVFGVST